MNASEGPTQRPVPQPPASITTSTQPPADNGDTSWISRYLTSLKLRIEAEPVIHGPSDRTHSQPARLRPGHYARSVSRSSSGVQDASGKLVAYLQSRSMVLVVGESGIGKSTLVGDMALDAMAQDGVPFLINAAVIVEDEESRDSRRIVPIKFLHQLICSEVNELDVSVSVDDIATLLKGDQDNAPSITIVIDGLNELPSANLRQKVLKSLPQWQASIGINRCHVVVTSTKEGYREFGNEIPQAYESLPLDLLLPEEVGEFLDVQIAALRPELSEEDRKTLWEPVLSEVRAHQDVYGLPIYLSAVASTLAQSKFRRPLGHMHSSNDAMNLMMQWMVNHQVEQLGQEFTADTIRRVLVAVVGELGWPSPALHAIERSQAVSAATKTMPDCDARTAERVLDSLCATGSVLRRSKADLLFKEIPRDFFAAEYLANQFASANDVTEQTLRLLLADNHSRISSWLPLRINDLYGQGACKRFFESLYDKLVDLDNEQFIGVLYKLQDSIRLLRLSDGKVDWFGIKWQEAVPRLRKIQTSTSGFRQRYVAARSAALLGFHQCSDDPIPDEIVWFENPQAVILGAQATDPDAMGYDPLAVAWERKPHKVAPDPFGISRYPITCHQYRHFIDDGGYVIERFWTPEGLEWLGGQSTSHRMPLDWDLFCVELDDPVTGVSIHEAEAYAAWLSNRTSKRVSLPTEEQWEYAARTESRGVFPWGNVITTGEKAECNWAGLFKRTKCPVMLFPHYETASGVGDLIGNVEEWCTDAWHSDNLSFENVGLPGKRVLKGGSSIRYSRLCRSSYRSRMLPASRYHTVGFRIVVAL